MVRTCIKPNPTGQLLLGELLHRLVRHAGVCVYMCIYSPIPLLAYSLIPLFPYFPIPLIYLPIPLFPYSPIPYLCVLTYVFPYPLAGGRADADAPAAGNESLPSASSSVFLLLSLPLSSPVHFFCWFLWQRDFARIFTLVITLGVLVIPPGELAINIYIYILIYIYI
jgi:hypothetical protein